MPGDGDFRLGPILDRFRALGYDGKWVVHPDQIEQLALPTANGQAIPLAVGNTVSVKGLLFNTSGTPTLVTRTVRDRD